MDLNADRLGLRAIELDFEVFKGGITQSHVNIEYL